SGSSVKTQNSSASTDIHCAMQGATPELDTDLTSSCPEVRVTLSALSRIDDFHPVPDQKI
ncbi:hypothetical protein, partial [Deinococcus aerophilus]|uniref:hypothetical protein n=1 Tax=Deinococcus aerophilus TaxID=522488 RepID=UPI001E53DDCC